jgi:4-amino-4-deoxy-L-arabinose transferase-like glycosyltransferase
MTASHPASRRAAIRQDLPAAVEAWVDGIAASRRLSALTIVLVALVVFLPGFVSIGALDRDEPNFATVSRLMVQTGDYVGPARQIGIVPPVAVLWLQAASAELFGNVASIWIYRIPSLLAAMSAALATWWMTLAFGRPRAALFAGAIMAVTPLLVAEAHLAKADALSLVAVILAEAVLARLWLRKRDSANYHLAAIFWAAVLIGFLSNAPAAIAAVGLTAVTLAAYSRSFGWLRGLAPLGSAAGIGLILLGLVALLLLNGGNTGDLFEGVAVQEDYKAPPGSYAVLFYPLFGPAGVFAALMLPAVLERVRRPVFAFAIACVAPYWLLTELLPVKLPPYILPAYPALALLAGTAIDEGRLRVTGWISAYFALNLAVWPVLVSIGALALYFVAEKSVPVSAVLLFAAAIVAGVVSLRWFYRGISVVGSAVLAVVATALIYIGLFGSIFPGTDALRVAERAVEAARRSAACEKPLMVAAGYSEPSLLFATNADVRFVRPSAAADFLREGGCRVALVEARRQAIFNQRAADLGIDPEVRASVRGFNLGNWNNLNIRIFMLPAAAQ